VERIERLENMMEDVSTAHITNGARKKTHRRAVHLKH